MVLVLALGAAFPPDALGAESATVSTAELAMGGGRDASGDKWGALAITTYGVPLLAHTLHNIQGLRRGEQVGTPWLFSGYALGSVGFLGGGALIIAEPTSMKSVIPGAVLLSLGALDLAVTIYRHLRSPKRGRQIEVVPLVGAGAQGTTFGGVAVNVSGF
jgi:hypothetical protein